MIFAHDHQMSTSLVHCHVVNAAQMSADFCASRAEAQRALLIKAKWDLPHRAIHAAKPLLFTNSYHRAALVV